MRTDVSARILGGAQRALAALAILAVFGLATPPASANITLSYTATDVGTAATSNNNATPATNTMSVPTVSGTFLTVGNFRITISTSTNDPGGGTTTFPGFSNISTTTIAIDNTGTAPSPDTLDLYVTGQGFTVGTNDYANFSVSGTTGGSSSSSDTTTGSSYVSTSNTAYGGSALSPGTGTAIPPAAGLTGTPSTFAPSKSYTFTGGGNSGTLSFTNTGTFALTQLLAITLAAGDSAQFTISTTALTPEPSTMALAGLGALGMIGFGLRRKARGV